MAKVNLSGAVRWLRLALPFIHLGIEEAKTVLGGNHKTLDALSYVSKVLDSIVNGGEIPAPPASLSQK